MERGCKDRASVRFCATSERESRRGEALLRKGRRVRLVMGCLPTDERDCQGQILAPESGMTVPKNERNGQLGRAAASDRTLYMHDPSDEQVVTSARCHGDAADGHLFCPREAATGRQAPVAQLGS